MDLGDRMKNYEQAYDLHMPSRLPVIVRVDGKGFSKFTKKIKAEKPFDETFNNAMAFAMHKASERIEGCVFAYTQSDEMTFVIKNDQSNESTPWFGNRIQKITSVVSSFVTGAFNKYLQDNSVTVSTAFFDTRVFVVPSWQEAVNCIVWRQNDATKNSISAACYYEVAKITGKKTARKMMHGLNQNQQQELLFKETKINWNDYPTKFKRGVGCYKVTNEFSVDGKTFVRAKWIIDEELPIISKEQDFLLNIFTKEA